MGRIVVTEFISVDGVIEDPGGNEKSGLGGWAFEFDRGDAGNKFKLDETMASEALLLGRVTYEGFAAAWPSRKDDAGFADKFNNMPKFVVSKTLKDPSWTNTTVLAGDVVEEVSAVRDRLEGDIVVHGSGTLARELLANDLVDQLNLMFFPVVLGRGKKLFGDSEDKIKLRVSESHTFGDQGVYGLVLQRA